jgi:hypothetical protein
VIEIAELQLHRSLLRGGGEYPWAVFTFIGPIPIPAGMWWNWSVIRVFTSLGVTCSQTRYLSSGSVPRLAEAVFPNATKDFHHLLNVISDVYYLLMVLFWIVLT